MKKTLLLKTMLLLFGLIVGSTSAWADEEVTLWSEDFSFYSADDIPSGGTYSYVCVDNGSNKTKIYDAALAGGTTPELLVGKSGGSFTATIPLDNIEGDLTLTFKTNYQKIGVRTTTTGITGGAEEKIEGEHTVTFSGVTTSMTEIVIEFYSFSSNVRLDDILLKGIHVEETPSFTITAVSNNTEWGTVSGTTTITATPEDGYRVVAGDDGYTVTSGEATVVNNGNNTLSVTPTTDCTVQINFEAIPTHTVTWSINGTETSEDVAEGAAITFPANPADLGGKKFVGWTAAAIDGTTDDAPTFVTSATMGTSDLKYYAVYATQSGSGENGWVETTLASLTATDVFVIVGDNGDTYAMSNDGGTSSAPTAVAVTVADGKITSAVADDIKWTISGNADDGYTFYPNGSTTTWLYCTSTNNGVRVGTNVNKTFTISAEGYLYHGGTSRYVGIYSSQDWRCYTSINSNIKDQSFAFYKYVEGSCSGYCTLVPTTATATIPAGKEWITFCSSANLDFSEAIEGLKGAYTITAHESQAITLTATEMTGAVKAGTGLLFRAAEKKDVAQVINIPVAATGEEQTDNMLIGVTVDTDIQPTADDYTNLGLSNGAFHPYSEAGTLAAGKAYLQIPTEQMPTAGNNAKLIIVFDGEATGIANLNVDVNDNFDANAPMYNLAGQRVNKSYKGVVIVNGKKVVRK